MTTPIDSSQRSFGPIRLVPGVTPGQVLLFIFLVASAYCVVLFMPMMQALVFTEILKLPKAEHGRLAGQLVTTQQIAVLLFIGLTGSLADRLGRKRVLLTAIIGYAVLLVLYPIAGSVGMLFLLQFIFGMLTTGHITGTSTMIADYPDNASRGKFVAALILIQAAVSAVVIGWVGARLPSWLVASGAATADAGRYAFWIVAGVAAFAGAVAVAWLRNPPRASSPTTVAAKAGLAEGLRTFWANARRVVAYGRVNPRFGLVMTMGIVIRSDYFVMLSFVSLWVIRASTSQGISSVDALKRAGLLILTLQMTTAIAPLLFGFISDRVERSRLLIVALVLTGFSLVATCLISDVNGIGMFVVVGAIGLTESALIVCGQTMLGEEAPVDLRGSSLGLFYFAGTLGVIIMSSLAGLMFDKIGYSAPFVMVGTLNLLFGAVGAVVVLRRHSADSTKTALNHAA
jgi:MFS family permease